MTKAKLKKEDLLCDEGYKTAYELPPLKANDFIREVNDLTYYEDCIESMLPKNQVGIIPCGEPWGGKSLELQALAYNFGAGGLYHGLRLKKCQAMYITWEGAGRSISRRLDTVSLQHPPEIEPIIKLASHHMPLNHPMGFNQFRKLLDEANKVNKVEVLLVDSFSYTAQGKLTDDDVIRKWWDCLQKLIQEYDITPIFSWEFNKPLILDRRNPETFTIARLKTAATTAYRVNTVVAIGDEKDYVKNKWTSVGHRIVVLKAKDSPRFEPLKVTLGPCLTWEGQHWEFDPKRDVWAAIND